MFYFEEPSIERKQQAIDYINEFTQYNSAINGDGRLRDYLNDYEKWLEYLKFEGTIVPSEESVPTKTYFFVNKNLNRIIGMVNIRLAMNEKVKKYGHIGYSIRPTERRNGYNKVNLYLALTKCNEFNIEEVLMVCKKDNVASLKTIESLGGQRTGETEEDYNYIIDVSQAIKMNKYLVSNL